jgi:ribosomal protein L37AE/L43A
MDPRVAQGYTETPQCPNCGKNGERTELNGQPVWRCPHCEQLWPVVDAHG